MMPINFNWWFGSSNELPQLFSALLIIIIIIDTVTVFASTVPVMGYGTATLMDNTMTAVVTALEVGYR